MEIIKYECPKRCHLYGKSFEEVIEAGQKHREKVLVLKEISENQKVKISDLRNQRNGVQDQLDNLELQAQEDHEHFIKMKKENIELKEKIKSFEKESKDESQLFKDEEVRKLNLLVESLTMKINDKEDEIIVKDIEILKLEKSFEKIKEVENISSKGLSQSLEEELNLAFNKEHVDDLKDEETKAHKRKVYLDKISVLTL